MTGASTTGATARPATSAPGPRSAPRWETIVTLAGDEPTVTDAFPILANAIQRRARWKCASGALRIVTEPPPRRPAPLVDASCPGNGIDYAVITGAVRLHIEAGGPWTVVVDQQVDTPLQEPPVAGTESAAPLAEAAVYPIERDGAGTVRLFTLGSGVTVVRFVDLRVSENTDLFVWLSEAGHPRTSAEATAAPHVVLGNLKSTVGSQNYELPPDVPPGRVRPIVIWCEPVRIAYAAAALTG